MTIRNAFNKTQVEPMIDFLKEIQNSKEYAGVLLKFKNGNVLTCFNLQNECIDDEKNLSCFNYNQSTNLVKSIVNNLTSTAGQMITLSVATASNVVRFMNMDSNLLEEIKKTNTTVDINVNQSNNDNVNNFITTTAFTYFAGFVIFVTLKHLTYLSEKNKTYVSLQGKEGMPLFISEEYKDKYFYYNSKTQELSCYDNWASYKMPSFIYNLYDKNANKKPELIPTDINEKFKQHHKVFLGNKVGESNYQTVRSTSSHDSGINSPKSFSYDVSPL